MSRMHADSVAQAGGVSCTQGRGAEHAVLCMLSLWFHGAQSDRACDFQAIGRRAAVGSSAAEPTPGLQAFSFAKFPVSMLCNNAPAVRHARVAFTRQPRHHICSIQCSVTRRHTEAGKQRSNRPLARRQQRELPNGQGVILDQAITGSDIVYGQTSRQLPNGQGCITDAGTFVITRPRRRSYYSLIPRPGLLLEMTAAIIFRGNVRKLCVCCTRRFQLMLPKVQGLRFSRFPAAPRTRTSALRCQPCRRRAAWSPSSAAESPMGQSSLTPGQRTSQISPVMPQPWHALASFRTKLAAAHLIGQTHRRCRQQAQSRQSYMLHVLACIGHSASEETFEEETFATFNTLPDIFLAPAGSRVDH